METNVPTGCVVSDQGQGRWRANKVTSPCDIKPSPTNHGADEIHTRTHTTHLGEGRQNSTNTLSGGCHRHPWRKTPNVTHTTESLEAPKANEKGDRMRLHQGSTALLKECQVFLHGMKEWKANEKVNTHETRGHKDGQNLKWSAPKIVSSHTRGGDCSSNVCLQGEYGWRWAKPHSSESGATHPWGGLWGQNYFYNDTQTVLALFTVSMFAWTVQKLCWVNSWFLRMNHNGGSDCISHQCISFPTWHSHSKTKRECG